MIKITNLYDNITTQDCALKSMWGFSCVIETPNDTILFDTGGNGRVLLENMKKKNIDIKKITKLFVSHTHWDHMGGIDSVVELNPNLDIFVTKSLPKSFVAGLIDMSNSITHIQDIPTKIDENLYSSGTLSSIMEQSLFIDTPDGVVVVAGCAHGKIEVIAKIAKEYLKKDILLLVGGFHLHKDMQRINKVVAALKDLSVKYIAPSHCTGEEGKKVFLEQLEDKYIDSGLGVSLFIKNNIVNRI